MVQQLTEIGCDPRRQVTPADLKFMRLALRLAARGRGRTSPNPCVGAVVVQTGEIVGRGYHRRAGTPHAEVHALLAAGARARGATLYVTLEPCNHTGRTPPCTRAILQSGISRVVVGMADPNPGVTGGGSRFLARQGLEVVTGVLARECGVLNRPFLKHCATGFPWVVMKAGSSLDGRIALGPGHSGWLTSERSRREVHRLRDRTDAILVGIGTALADDPSLTTRPTGRDPLRVVLDSRLRLPPSARMLGRSSPAATWVFCGPEAGQARQQALEAAGAVVKRVGLAADGRLDLPAVLAELGRAGITSLLVEGGSQVHAGFLGAGLVDQVSLFLAPLLLGEEGVPLVGGLRLRTLDGAPRLKVERLRRLDGDLLVEALLEGASQAENDQPPV